jgi:hypothetical protein
VFGGRVTTAQSQDLIIFLHVPKTAGSTLRHIIEREHDPTRLLHLYDSDFAEELAAIPQTRMARLRVVMGHFYFGAHTFLSQPSAYITFLRDPIDRVISEYYFVRRSPAHHFHDSARRISLEEFVKYCSDNNQTRQLAGRCGVPSLGTDSSEMLNTAKKNLAEYFSVVGVTEEFDSSLILISRLMGWRHPFYVRKNVTRHHPGKEQLRPETLRVVQAYNELDLELHSYARKLLHEQIRQCGPSFERELRWFKTMNPVYGRLYLAGRGVRRRAMAKITGAGSSPGPIQ